MKHSLKLLAVSAIALVMCIPAAYAQTPEVSTLVITESTDVGGTILQPGTYLVRVVSPQADRNKVQITSVDRSTIYATLLTVPHELEPNEEITNTTFVYFPSNSGMTRTLRTWFPSDPVIGGHDFIYSESRAKQLARLVNEPVVSYRTSEEIAEYNIVTPEATIEPYEMPAPVAPAPEPAPVAEVTPAPVPEPAPLAPVPAPEPVTEPAPMVSSTEETPEMPETAGRIPLMVLIGLASLAAAVVVRMARHA